MAAASGSRHSCYRSQTEGIGCRFTDLVDGYGAVDLAERFDYTNYQGAPFANTRAEVLTHMFNHQTHHRGQAHGLLSHAGAEPPELDFIFYLRETA